MTGGRKPVPTSLKRLHGNPGHRPVNTSEPQGQGTLWAPPAWFDDVQREQWHYAIDWAPPGLLTATDRDILVAWVVACVEHARACQEVRRVGQVIRTNEGNPIQNPYLGVMNRQALIMIRAGSELGFSPAARTALGNHAPEFPAHGPSSSPSRSRLQAYIQRNPDQQRLDS